MTTSVSIIYIANIYMNQNSVKTTAGPRDRYVLHPRHSWLNQLVSPLWAQKFRQPSLAAKMPGSKVNSQLFDFIGGKGGTRTLDPGIMRTIPGKKAS